jgi:hypothetical protein
VSKVARPSEYSVLLIDDDEDLLAKLGDELRPYAEEDRVEVRSWRPSDGENPISQFHDMVDDRTLLVVTDYDLTGAGLTGLFGASIVSWCQARFIPAGDFSRGNRVSLPSEPNLFELRVPTDMKAAVRYARSMYRGFRDLRAALADQDAMLSTARSPAEVLAAVVRRPALESQFTLYMSLLGAANASLLDSLREVLSPSHDIDNLEKARLLAYVVGHVLANAVLRYPGPILSERALCAYVATVDGQAQELRAMFAEARYDGPFSDDVYYYWRSGVDDIIARFSEPIGDTEFEGSGQFSRAVVEAVLGHPLENHECTRCGGVNGGYLCSFTNRTVCDRSDCSVAANSWIPLGADLCRVERDFYDEWSPILGL